MSAIMNAAIPFECRQRLAGNVAMLDLRGQLVDDEAGGRFHEWLRRLARRGDVHVILDLRDLAPLDISSLSALLVDLVKFRQNGGDLGLLYVPKETLDLLRKSATITAFRIFASEEAALHEFLTAERGNGTRIEAVSTNQASSRAPCSVNRKSQRAAETRPAPVVRTTQASSHRAGVSDRA